MLLDKPRQLLCIRTRPIHCQKPRQLSGTVQRIRGLIHLFLCLIILRLRQQCPIIRCRLPALGITCQHRLCDVRITGRRTIMGADCVIIWLSGAVVFDLHISTCSLYLRISITVAHGSSALPHQRSGICFFLCIRRCGGIYGIHCDVITFGHANQTTGIARGFCGLYIHTPCSGKAGASVRSDFRILSILRMSAGIALRDGRARICALNLSDQPPGGRTALYINRGS